MKKIDYNKMLDIYGGGCTGSEYVNYFNAQSWLIPIMTFPIYSQYILFRFCDGNVSGPIFGIGGGTGDPNTGPGEMTF